MVTNHPLRQGQISVKQSLGRAFHRDPGTSAHLG